jgi:hypothetical protein
LKRHPRTVVTDRALFVFGIRILGRRLPGGDRQSGESDLRLLWFSADELDQKHPFVAIVEERTHLRADRRKSLGDTRPLDAPCFILALSKIDKQLVADRRTVNVSLQPAIKTEGVVEVEIEEADNRLCQGPGCTGCRQRISKSRWIFGLSEARKMKVSVSAIRLPLDRLGKT